MLTSIQKLTVRKRKKSIPNIDMSALRGIWKVAYFRGSPDYDSQLVEGHLLQLLRDGSLSVVSGGKLYKGQWQFNQNEGSLQMRLPGNWFTFVLSNEWKLMRAGKSLLKLMKMCRDGVQELHLERV